MLVQVAITAAKKTAIVLSVSPMEKIGTIGKIGKRDTKVNTYRQYEKMHSAC